MCCLLDALSQVLMRQRLVEVPHRKGDVLSARGPDALVDSTTPSLCDILLNLAQSLYLRLEGK